MRSTECPSSLKFDQRYNHRLRWISTKPSGISSVQFVTLLKQNVLNVSLQVDVASHRVCNILFNSVQIVCRPVPVTTGAAGGYTRGHTLVFLLSFRPWFYGSLFAQMVWSTSHTISLFLSRSQRNVKDAKFRRRFLAGTPPCVGYTYGPIYHNIPITGLCCRLQIFFVSKY